MTNHAIDGMGNSFGIARAPASEGSTARVFKRVGSRPGFWLTAARSLAVATLLSFAAAGFVNAQDRRAGGWMDVAFGYGSASFSCDTCTVSQRLDGWTLSLAGGGTLTPHVRLGADLRMWLNGLKGGGKPLPGIVVVAMKLFYYPRAHGGPFLLGGGGLSLYGVCKGRGDPIEPCSNDASYSSGSGWGFTLGAGQDIRIGRVTLRPLLEYHHGLVGRLHAPDGYNVATGWNQNLLTVELRLFGNLGE